MPHSRSSETCPPKINEATHFTLNSPGVCSTPTSKSNISAIIGGAVGGVAFVLLLLGFVFACLFLRTRNKTRRTTPAVESQPTDDLALTSELAHQNRVVPPLLSSCYTLYTAYSPLIRPPSDASLPYSGAESTRPANLSGRHIFSAREHFGLTFPRLEAQLQVRRILRCENKQRPPFRLLKHPVHKRRGVVQGQ